MRHCLLILFYTLLQVSMCVIMLLLFRFVPLGLENVREFGGEEKVKMSV